MRLRKWTLSLILAGSIGTLPSPAASQSATTGAIRGRVLGADGTAIGSAQVTATNSETGLARNALASDAGVYNVPLLPPGVYTVRAQRIGFQPVAVANVRVRLNETTSLDILLQPAATQLADVTVTAERELQVDTRQTGVAEYVSEREIANLPTLGRDFSDFIALSGLVSPQPEVSTGGTVAIGGGRSSGVNVQIDGADANMNFFGESRGGARIPFTFSLESIKEFQIVTNGYDVEFGNYSSGVVNVVTKGGTNQFRALGQAFFRNELLTGDNFRQTVLRSGRDSTLGGERPRDFQVMQVSASVSGPAIKDRLHYLFSYDGQRRKDPFEAATLQGSGIARDTVNRMISILENVYGLQGAGSDFGRFNKTDDNDVFFGRMDWTMSERNRASFRGNYANYRSENDGLQFGGNRARSFASTFRDKNLSVVGELNTIFSPSTYNVLRVQYANEERPRVSNNFLPLINVTTGNTSLQWGGSGITFRNDLRESKWQLINTLTHTRGDHTFKLGTNNLLSEVFNKFWLLGAGEYRFANLDSLQNRAPSQYLRNIPETGPRAPETTFDMSEYSVFLQDEWQMTARLLLTAGLRYDMARYGDAFAKVPAIDVLPGIAPFQSGNRPEDDDNISPRLSLAYDVLGNGNHVVRAGAGYFYGRVPGVLGSNVGTGTVPYLSLDCRIASGNVPPPDFSQWDPTGDENPAACTPPSALSAAKEYTFWGKDFEYPETFKTNLGYEGRLAQSTRFGIDGIFSRTRKNFTVQDLALRGTPTRILATEGRRPVYATSWTGTNPRDGASTAQRSRFAGQSISRIFVNDNQGVAEEIAITTHLDHRVGRAQLRASYTYNRAKDNSSFFCCTSFEGLFGFRDPTAGDLNDKGGRKGANWGNSSFVRPHTIVLSGLVDLPAGFQVSGILRSNSGTYFTPTVFGDLNGDGERNNDRPFIGFVGGNADSLIFENATERAQYDSLLAQHRCLNEALGRIIERNSCPNPWFTQLDMSVRKAFPMMGGRELELVVDLFNVLNGLNQEWGRFRRVGQQQLFDTRSFNPTANKYVYRVNETFGQYQFIGPARQFQIQLGARVTF